MKNKLVLLISAIIFLLGGLYYASMKSANRKSISIVRLTNESGQQVYDIEVQIGQTIMTSGDLEFQKSTNVPIVCPVSCEVGVKAKLKNGGAVYTERRETIEPQDTLSLIITEEEIRK